MSETVDPEALINEALRECYGLPGKVPTVKEALLNIFGMGSDGSEEPMQAQGPGMSTETEEEVDDSRQNFPAEGESQEHGLYYEIGKRRKNGPHIHNCCDQIYEHESFRKFACPKCHKESECVPTIRNTGKGSRWPRYNENIPTLSPTNHEGKHEIQHAHKCSHAGCTVRIVHLHGSPTMETHGPRSCFQHQVENVDPCHKISDSHGSNSGQKTQRYLCAFPKCKNQMGMRNAKAGLKYCKEHESQSGIAPLAGDIMAGNITIDEAIEKYKYDENGNMSGGNNKGKRTFKKTSFAAQAAAEIKTRPRNSTPSGILRSKSMRQLGMTLYWRTCARVALVVVSTDGGEFLGEFIVDRHATSEYTINRSSERLNG